MLWRFVKCWCQIVKCTRCANCFHQTQLKSSGRSFPWSKAQTWKSHSSDGAGRDWLVFSVKQQLSFWRFMKCREHTSSFNLMCGFWALDYVILGLLSSPQSWKTSNLHPQNSGTLAGSSISSRARTRGVGSKTWQKKCWFEKNPMPFRTFLPMQQSSEPWKIRTILMVAATFTPNPNYVGCIQLPLFWCHQTGHIQVHFEWDDFVRFRELCNINITEAHRSMLPACWQQASDS